MFKKNIILIFSILLTLTCFFELFPTFYTYWKEYQAYKISKNKKINYKLALNLITKKPLNLYVKQITYKEAKDKQLKLGLDLKGGISLILEISQKELLQNLSNYTTNIYFNEILSETDKIQTTSSLSYIDNFFKIYYQKKKKNKFLEKSIKSCFQEKFKNKIHYNTTDKEIEHLIKNEIENLLHEAFDIIRTRIDHLGVTQANIQRISGSGRMQIELPGANQEKRINKILQTSARLEFWEVHHPHNLHNYLNEILYFDAKTPKNIYPGIMTVNLKDTNYVSKIIYSKKFINSLPIHLKKSKFLWSSKPINNTNKLILYCVHGDKNGQAYISGSIKEASIKFDPMNHITVNMKMDEAGTKKWKNLTYKNQGDYIAIVLDNLVYTVPNVNEVIKNGNSQISGNFSKNEAQDLVDVLQSGKLPASAKILQSVVIGSTLGDQAIHQGIQSFFLALIFILFYMIILYGRPGFYANIALLSNLFFIISIMSSIGCTLTLSGIAGIILTLGMAVDTNIIIFERIKEEYKKTNNIKNSVIKGHSEALSAIFDANITTLISSLILFYFGSGPIKGFATTLIIGIFCTLFTGIFLTQFFIETRLEKNKNITFLNIISQNYFIKFNWNWIKIRKLNYIISLILILISLISLTIQGLNLGIDYTGGRSYIIKFNKSINPYELSTQLSAFLNEGINTKIDVKKFGYSNQIKITTKYKINQHSKDINEEINLILYKALKKYLSNSLSYYNFINGNLQNEGIVSAIQIESSFTKNIKEKAYYAIIFSLLGIFFYLLIRFKKWEFSIGAIIALFHDVLIVLGFFSCCYKYFPFSLEINESFIAALLTVIGYSINDTVVVFDRIRENLNIKSKNTSLKNIFNNSINQTLGRTLNTSLTTILVIFIIFVFGGENIKNFMLALLIGIIIGTFSSIFIASMITFDLLKKKFYVNLLNE